MALSRSTRTLATFRSATESDSSSDRPPRRVGTRLAPDVRRAVDRLTFGQTPELLDEIHRRGLADFLARQLDPASIDDSACDAELSAFRRLYLPATELIGGAHSQWELQNELVGMSVVRAVKSRRQLLEVMVDFWSNHLSVNAAKHQVSYFLPADNATVRRLALGRFDELLAASARSPSMLSFLDNRTSRADGTLPPNENYARELLEIHTLGDPAAFNEADIKAVAHVFTGWTIDRSRWTFVFRPEWNRLGPASRRQTLGWRPEAGDGSEANGRSLLAHLARHPLTARNLCHKLCRYFIGDNIGADDATVRSVTARYLESGTDIRATLRALFASDAFRSPTSTRIRRPNELLYAMLRATSAQLPLGDVQHFGRRIKEELVRLDQVTFQAPSPKGYPFEDAAWTDASSMIARWNLAFRLAADRADGARVALPDYAQGASNVGHFVDRIGTRLLGEPPPEAERRHLIAHLGATAGEPVTARMRRRQPALVGLTLASPHFQTR